jgi:hypothetical protein
MQIKQADLSRANGKLDEALVQLEDVRDKVDPNSKLYFDAKKRISEVLVLKKDYRKAVEYPEFVLITAGLEAPMVRDGWPNIKEFLKSCYDKGVKMSPEVAKILNQTPAPENRKDSLGDGKEKTEPKTDEKVEQKTEPKAEPKTEEKTEPKPEQKTEEKTEPKPEQKTATEPKAGTPAP